MAVPTLSPAVIALADDPSQAIEAFTNGRSRVLEVPGSVRRMANGRLRTVRRAGSARQVGVTLVSVTPAQVVTLESWAGRTVLYRDSWGCKVFGAYFNVAVVDFTDRKRHNVTLSLSEVTVSEFA